MATEIPFTAFPKQYSSTSSASSTPQSLSLDEYHITSIGVQDQDEVINFLRLFFFRDEPLNASVQLLDNEDANCPELEEYSAKTIADDMSVMAIASDGQIIGVCLNGIIRKKEIEDLDTEDEDNTCSNKKFCKIIKFLKYVERESDIFGKYPDISKILYVKILSVNGSWRGKGIAKELMDRTREMAREEGFGLMRGDCTSYYSAKAFARLGFQCIYSFKYSDYVEDGEIVFKPDPPHDEIKIYVQEI